MRKKGLQIKVRWDTKLHSKKVIFLFTYSRTDFLTKLAKSFRADKSISMHAKSATLIILPGCQIYQDAKSIRLSNLPG